MNGSFKIFNFPKKVHYFCSVANIFMKLLFYFVLKLILLMIQEFTFRCISKKTLKGDSKFRPCSARDSTLFDS